MHLFTWLLKDKRMTQDDLWNWPAAMDILSLTPSPSILSSQVSLPASFTGNFSVWPWWLLSMLNIGRTHEGCNTLQCWCHGCMHSSKVVSEIILVFLKKCSNLHFPVGTNTNSTLAVASSPNTAVANVFVSQLLPLLSMTHGILDTWESWRLGTQIGLQQSIFTDCSSLSQLAKFFISWGGIWLYHQCIWCSPLVLEKLKASCWGMLPM